MPWLLYKTNRFDFAMALYSDNAQRTSKRGGEHQSRYSPAARSVLLCSHHVLTSSVRYQSTDPRQNGIYLLNNNNIKVTLKKVSFKTTLERTET